MFSVKDVSKCLTSLVYSQCASVQRLHSPTIVTPKLAYLQEVTEDCEPVGAGILYARVHALRTPLLNYQVGPFAAIAGGVMELSPQIACFARGTAHITLPVALARTRRRQ